MKAKYQVAQNRKKFVSETKIQSMQRQSVQSVETEHPDGERQPHARYQQSVNLETMNLIQLGAVYNQLGLPTPKLIPSPHLTAQETSKTAPTLNQPAEPLNEHSKKKEGFSVSRVVVNKVVGLFGGAEKNKPTVSKGMEVKERKNLVIRFTEPKSENLPSQKKSEVQVVQKEEKANLQKPVMALPVEIKKQVRTTPLPEIKVSSDRYNKDHPATSHHQNKLAESRKANPTKSHQDTLKDSRSKGFNSLT